MQRESLRRAVAAVVLVLLLGAGAPVRALTDEEIFRDFRFNFINPGARSVGLGGAYIAAAADATAAEANPAALHYISRSEAFVEYRVRRPDLQVQSPSRMFGSNDPGSMETFTDFQLVNDREDDELLSFVSFAQPFKLGKRRATVAVSRQTVLSVENSLESQELGLDSSVDVSLTTFPLVVNPGPPPSVGRYIVRNEVEGQLDLELIHYNAAFSISLTDHFSLGVTATMAQLDVQSEVLGRASDPLGFLSSINPRIDTGGGLSDIQQLTQIDDSDQAFGWAIGLHWHPDRAFPNRDYLSPIRFGVVYRKGAKLGVEETKSELDPMTGNFVVDERFQNTLKVPDRFGVGMSYEAGENWLFALDGERILYSDLLEDFRAGENFFTSGIIPSTLLPIDPDTLVFDVDDATVVHAGIEYSFISRGSWNHAIRVGYYNAPDNRIRLEGIDLESVNPGDPQNAQLEAIYRDLFRGGDDENHYTVGFSINTPAGLNLQFAGDWTEENTDYVASAIWRFGRTRR